MVDRPHQEGNLNPEQTERVEGRNVTEIAQLLSEKLSRDEMYDVVLAIESPNFHEAVIAQWKMTGRPEK